MAFKIESDPVYSNVVLSFSPASSRGAPPRFTCISLEPGQSDFAELNRRLEQRVRERFAIEKAKEKKKGTRMTTEQMTMKMLSHFVKRVLPGMQPSLYHVAQIDASSATFGTVVDCLRAHVAELRSRRR